MYNHMIKMSFYSPKMPKALAKKTGFNLMIIHFFLFVENWI